MLCSRRLFQVGLLNLSLKNAYVQKGLRQAVKFCVRAELAELPHHSAGQICGIRAAAFSPVACQASLMVHSPGIRLLTSLF